MVWIESSQGLPLRAKLWIQLIFTFFHINIALVLFNFSMGPIKLYRLQQVLHLLVTFCIDGIINFINEEVIVLLLPLLLFYFVHLEIFLAFFHSLFCYVVKYCWHLFWNFWSLDLSHGLPHLLFIGISYSNYLICCRNLTLTYLVRVFHVVLEL